MILIAIPTNGQRPDALKKTIRAWKRNTPVDLTFHITEHGDTWCAGLNDAYRAYPGASIFICGSDDMYPENDRWLDPVVEALERNESPVPLMLDPRFTIYGGSQQEVPDGSHTHMTNFPVLKRAWLKDVFPLPDDLHYYGDNLIADRLHAIGVPTVATLDFVIRHDHDPRGRGAGMGDESTRMEHDRQVYRSLKRAAS